MVKLRPPPTARDSEFWYVPDAVTNYFYEKKNYSSHSFEILILYLYLYCAKTTLISYVGTNRVSIHLSIRSCSSFIWVSAGIILHVLNTGQVLSQVLFSFLDSAE